MIIFIKGGVGSGNFGHSGREGFIGGSGGFNTETYQVKVSNDIAYMTSKDNHPIDRAQKLVESYALNDKLFDDGDIDYSTQKKIYNSLLDIHNQIGDDLISSAKDKIDRILAKKLPSGQSQAELENAKQEYCGLIKEITLDKKTEIMFNNAIAGNNQKVLDGLNEGKSTEFNYGNALKTNNEIEIIKVLDNSLKAKTATEKAILVYQDTSACEAINASLRGGYSETYKDEIKTIDKAMKSTLNQDTILTRNVKGSHPMAIAINQSKDATGTVYTEQNYSSTSVNFDNQFGSTSDIRIRILTPKGTKGLAFSHNLELDYPDELEFCLPRGCSFEVTAMNYEKREVYVRLIDNGVTK